MQLANDYFKIILPNSFPKLRILKTYTYESECEHKRLQNKIRRVFQDSSLPCAVFVFSAKNVSNEHRDVSITFTWTEVLGEPYKKKNIGKSYNKYKSHGFILNTKSVGYLNK